MRMPSFRVRTLMIAVAAAAVATAVVSLWSRSTEFARMAAICGLNEAKATARAKSATRALARDPKGPAALPWRQSGEPEHSHAQIFRYRALRQKYLRAARYPWLAIEPDPPEPKSPFDLEAMYNEEVLGSP